jgi:DNA-directed RNA polymerase subunit K/omega
MHRVDVRLEIVLVLAVRALQVAEGGHAQADQIRPRPEPVAIEEARGFSLFLTAV